MTLDTPNHLRQLAAAALPVTHAWSQGDAMTALGSETPAMLNKLADMSFRAALGLRAALGEWMVQRFIGLHYDGEHVQVNEALWAASIDFRYLKIEAMNFPRDYGNVVTGPLQLSKIKSRDIADLYHKAAFGAIRYLIGSANLVRFVLSDGKAFQAWLKQVVAALPGLSQPSARQAGGFDVARKKTEPRGVPYDIFGMPVPREAYEPGFDPASANSVSLIDAMLVRISSEANPFLRGPAELVALGFDGNPYRYPAD